MTEHQTAFAENLLVKTKLLFTNRSLDEALNCALEGKNWCEEQAETELLFAFDLLLANIYNTMGRYWGDTEMIKAAKEVIQKMPVELVLGTHQQPTVDRSLALGQSYQNEKAYKDAAGHYLTALSDSRSSGNIIQQIVALIGLSENKNLQNKFTAALAYAEQALSLLPEIITDNAITAMVYNQLSQVYFKQQDYDRMLEYSQQVLAISRGAGDIEKELNALKNIAIYYAAKSAYKEAMEHFLESMDKSRLIDYRHHTAQCLINIGTIYANLYNHEDAILRYQIVLDEYSDVVSKNTHIVIYNNLGNIYYFSDRLEQAEQFFEKAYQLGQQRNYQAMVILSLANLSRTHIARKDLDKAMDRANQAEGLMADHGDISGKQINLLNLGQIHYLRGDLEKAMKLTSQGIVTAKRMKDDSSEIRGYQLLANIHQHQKDFETALKYQIVYSNAQERFSKEQRNRQVIDLEIKNAIKEKQKEIEQLTRENEYQGLLLKQSDQIAEQNGQLLAANEELRQFAYVASHDLKEPIRMIGSYTQLIHRLHKDQFNEDSNSYFKYVNEGVIRMNNLLDALLKYATVGKTEDEFEKVILNDIIDIAIINLRVRIDETKAVIQRADMPDIQSIKSLLIQLFQNLISNAIKFKKPDTLPQIDISLSTSRKHITIKISDNGIGIAPEYKDRVFVIFQRLHTRAQYEGTGIGLAICQKIVQRLGGKIWVESEFGEGADFFVQLPWNRN